MFAVVVKDAVRADIEALGKGLADSSFAAMALELASQLDDPGTSATAKSMCARVLLETMDRLTDLANSEVAGDRLDELTSRRGLRKAAG